MIVKELGSIKEKMDTLRAILKLNENEKIVRNVKNKMRKIEEAYEFQSKIYKILKANFEDKDEWYLLADLNLDIGEECIKIDYLIISENSIIIMDVNRIKGKVVVENGVWFAFLKNKGKTKIPTPSLSLRTRLKSIKKRLKYILGKLFQDKKLPRILHYSIVVLDKPIDYKKQRDNIILFENLNDEISKIVKESSRQNLKMIIIKFKKQLLCKEGLQKFSSLLMSHHSPIFEDFEQDLRPKNEYKEKFNPKTDPGKEFIGPKRAMYAGLLAVRSAISKEKRIPEEMIITRKELVDIVNIQPTTAAMTLSTVKGSSYFRENINKFQNIIE